MTSEIFSFLQTQANTQTQTQTQQSNTSENPEELQGLFDSMMNELTSSQEPEALLQQEIITQELPEAPETPDNNSDSGQVITFRGNSSFSQSVIDILAGIKNDNEAISDIPEKVNNLDKALNDVKKALNGLKEVLPESLNIGTVIDKVMPFVMNSKPVQSALSDLPEDTQQKIIQCLDDVAENVKNDDDIEAPILNLISNVADEVKHSDSESELEPSEPESDSTEDTPEIPDLNANIAGLSVIPNTVAPDTFNVDDEIQAEVNHVINQEVQQLTNSQQVQASRTTMRRENTSTQAKTEDTSTENTSNRTDFSEALEARTTERTSSTQNQNSNNPGNQDNDEGNNNDDSEGQDFSGARDNFSVNRNSSRSRNDTRRASNDSSRTQNERTNTTASRRTDSRNDFQGFFEGVLSNRRTASQSSPMPLNLRANLNLSQTETLRDGMTNVVRFIRADGLHRANIVIDPPALGRISVELTSGTSGVEASIKVSSEQIRQLVQDQLSQLRMNLSQQGVQVAEFTVDVQQDSQRDGQNSQDDNQNRRRTRAIGGVDDEEPEEFRIDLEEGLLYWVA